MARRSTKERVWLEEYFKCGFNATEAARRAGYKWPDKIGPRKKGKFQALIDAELKRRAMGADEVLARLSDIGRAEYADYITKSGQVDLEELIADGKAHLIKGTKFVGKDADQLVVEFYDAQMALAKLGKAHGLFKNVHTGPEGGPIKIEPEIGPMLDNLTNEQLDKLATIARSLTGDRESTTEA